MSGNQAPGFGKDPLTPCHGDSLVDQSFQSLKSKEIRDSMSPPHDMKFHALSLNHPNTTGWDVQTSSEVSPDGRAYRTETVAKTDGVEKIKGGTAEFKGHNEQRASASHQGDDKNFVKKASESSNTQLQENVVIGDENSGRTEMKMSSTTTSSSSQVISSSSTTDAGGAEPVDTRYLMDTSHRNQQQKQRMTQDQYEKQFQQQRQQHQQDRSLQDQYEEQFQQRRQQQDHSTTQQQKQQFSEEYNRNRQESTSSRNIETRQETEQSRRVVDMDKASPEYQQHVQYLMAQPGEVISSTVEYPKPNVKMITTVKRLPDGTVVKNKRYETEEPRPILDTNTSQRTTSSTNQSNTQQKTETRQQNEENIYSRQQNTDHRQNATSRRPNVDVVDNIETVNKNKHQLVESQPSDRITEDVSSSFSTMKKSSRRFSTETTSETIEEIDDRSPSSKPVSSRHVTPDFSTHGFPSVKPNKPTQEYAGERPHASNDFTTHGFPSVKPNKPSQEFPSDHPHAMRSTDTQHVTAQGSPVVRTIKTPDGDVIVVSSETSRSQKYKTNSERVIETEVVTDSGDYPSSGTGSRRPEPITYTISPNKPGDFTTHGFPSAKESSPIREGAPSREYPSSPRGSHPTEVFSTHGFPSVGSPLKTQPETFTVSSESRHSANRKANTEHIIETEVITDADYPTHGQRPEHVRYITPNKSNDFSTHGFPSVKDSSPLHEGSPRHGTPTRDYPSSPRRSQPTDDFSTHGFPSVRSPTKTTPGYARPRQTSPQRKPQQPTRTSPTRKSTNVETTQKVVHKEKETDAAHRAFAASLRSSSPVDNLSQTDHHRHTPRSSISSTKTFRRDMREGSHDSSHAPSETSRVSSSTVTRQSPSKNVGKTVVTKQTVVKTRNVNGSNETIDLTPQRSTTKSPSPAKTITTTTTKTTTTTNNKTPDRQTATTTVINEEVPKSDNLKPAANTFPINEPLTITKSHFSSNDASFPGNEVVEEPCIKKHFYQLGPSDNATEISDAPTKNEHSTTAQAPNSLKNDTSTDSTATIETTTKTTPTIQSTEITTTMNTDRSIESAVPLTSKPENETITPETPIKTNTNTDRPIHSEVPLTSKQGNETTTPETATPTTTTTQTTKISSTKKQPTKKNSKKHVTKKEKQKLHEKSPYSPAPSTIHKNRTHQPKNKSPTRDIANYPENYEPSSSSDIEHNYRNRSPSKPKESSPKFVRHPSKDTTSVERRTVVRETTFEKNENEPNFPVDHDNPECFVQPKERLHSPTRPQHSKQPKQAEFEIVSVPRGKTPDVYDSSKKPNEPINKPTNKKPDSPKSPVHSVKKTLEKTDQKHTSINEIELITDRKEKTPTDRNIPKYTPAPRQPIHQKQSPQKSTPCHVDNDDDDEDNVVATEITETIIDIKNKTHPLNDRNKLKGVVESRKPNNIKPGSSKSTPYPINDDEVVTTVTAEIITNRKSNTPTDRITPRDVSEPHKLNRPSYTKPGTEKYVPHPADEDDDDYDVVTTVISETETTTKPSKKPSSQKSAPYPTDDSHVLSKPKTRNENIRVDDVFQHTHKTKQTKNINEEFITTERDHQSHRPSDDESPDGGFISKNHAPKPTTPTSPTFKKKGLSQRETFEERCRHILGMEHDGDTQGAYKKHPDFKSDTDEEPIKKDKPQENMKKDNHSTVFEVKIEDCDDDEPLYISNVKETLETRKVTKTPKTESPAKIPARSTAKTVTDSEKLLESERISKPYPRTGTPFGNDFEEVIVTFSTDNDTTHKNLITETSDHLKKTYIRKTPERKPYSDDKPNIDNENPDAIRKLPTSSHPTTTNKKTTVVTEIRRSKSPEQKKPSDKPDFDNEKTYIFRKSPSPTRPKETTIINKKTKVVTETRCSKSPEQKEPGDKPDLDDEKTYVFRKTPSPTSHRDTTTINKKTTFAAEIRRSKSPDNKLDLDDEYPEKFRKSPSPTRPRDSMTTNKKSAVFTETRRSKSPDNKPNFDDEYPETFRQSPSPTRPRDTMTTNKKSAVFTETRRSKSPDNKSDFDDEKPIAFRKSPSPTKPRDCTTFNKKTTVVTEIRSPSYQQKPTKAEPKITKPKPDKPKFDGEKPRNSTKHRETTSFNEKSTIVSETHRSKSPEQRKNAKLEPESSSTSESESPDRESEVDTEKENFISEKYIKCTERSSVEKCERSTSPVSKRKSPEKPIHKVSETKPTSFVSSFNKGPTKKQPERITSPTRKQPITKDKYVEPVDHPKFKTTNKTPIKPVSKILNETNIEVTEKCNSTRISATPTGKSKNITPVKVDVQPTNRPQGKIPTKYPITTRKDSDKIVEETKRLRQPRKPSVESPTSTIKDRLRSSPRKQIPKADDVDAISSSPDTSPNRYTERRRSSNISVHTEIIIDHAGPKSPKPKEPLSKKQPHSAKQPSPKDLIDSTLSEKPSRRFPVTERKESAPVHRVTRKDTDVKMARSTSENVIKVTDKQPIRHPEMSSLSPKPNRRPNKCFTTKTINLTTQENIINSEDMENVIIDIQQAKSSREPSPDKIVPTPVPIDFETGKPRYPDVVQEPEDEPRRKPVVKNIPIFEEDTNEFVGCQISEIKIDKSSKISDYTDYNEILVNPTIEAPPSLEYPSIDKPDDDCLLSVHEKVSKFIHTAEEIKKPKASSPFNREFDETPRVPEDDDCLLSVDQKVSKFIRTAETITKPSVTPVREIERPNFDDIDEELRQDNCTLSVSQKVNKFINTAEKLAPTAPQRSPELVARIERTISRQSEPEYPYESSDNEPLIPFSENHTTEIEKKRQKDILSRPSVWKTNDEQIEIPTSEVHSTTLEIKRNQKSTDYEPSKVPRKPQSPVLKRSSITDKRNRFDNTEQTKITTEFTAGPSDYEPNKAYPRKPQSPDLKRSSLSDKTKHYVNLENTEGPSDFEPNKVHPKKSQSPVLKRSSITDKRKQFDTNEQTEITTENINSRYVKPVNDVKPKTTVESKTPRKDTPSETPKVSQPKGYMKYNTSTVSTARSRFETSKAEPTSTPRRKPSAESVSPKKTQPQNGQPKLECKRKPSTGPETQDSEIEIEIEEIEYQTTDTETELASRRRSSTKTVEHTTTATNGSVSPQRGTPNNRIITQGKYKKPNDVSHSPTNITPQKSTKTTVTSITERTLNHMSPSQQHPDTVFVETILEKPKPSPFSPIGRSKVTTETVAARRNIFEKGATPSKSPSKSPTPVQTGRRPSYMDHTKSSLEHVRRDSLEVNKSNYSRKSSVEDDTQYERRPNAAVKFDVPQRPRKEPSFSEDINIEEIFDLVILEHMLETVTSYELRRRIRAQIRLVKKNTLNTQTVDKKKSESKTSTSISSTHKSSSIYSSKMHHEETDSFSDDIHSKKPCDRIYSPKRTTKPQHTDDVPIGEVRYTTKKQPRDRSLSPQQPSKVHHVETVTIRDTKYSNKPHDRSQSPKRTSRTQPEETDTTTEGKYTKKPRERSHSPEAKTISSSLKEVRRESGSSNQYTRTEQFDYSSEEVVSSPVPERKRLVDTNKRQPHDRSHSPEQKPTSKPSHQKSPSKRPEYPTKTKALDRSSSPESKTKPQPYKSQPNGRSPSPQSKTTSGHEELYLKKTIKTTHSSDQSAPERKPSKPKPEEKTPIWADRKNILKNQSTIPTSTKKAPFCAATRPITSASKTAVRTTTSQQKQRQSKTTDEDSIISSYGIGPTDENGLPLFGIRALKKKKSQPMQPCETTEEVTGYVVEEKYYADSKTKPIVERKEYIYSTDADELEKIKKTVECRKSSNDDGVVRQFKKIDKEFIKNEPKAIMPENEEFGSSSTKYVRRGSVKEMSEKFIRKESSQSITEKSSSSYPKAGLILRTSLGGGTTTDAGDCFETSEHFTTTTTSSGTRRRPDDDEGETTDGDCEMQVQQHSSRMLNESESECESMTMKREMSSSKKSSKSSSSTRSFLNSSGDTKIVTGVDDVLERMRNADNVVEVGDTAEDQEARALLNKFLGASVIMRGVESVLPQTKQTKTTTTTTYANNGDNLQNQGVKTTRVTKTIQSGSSSSPVTRTTCDIEEIWDEEILKELLEQATTYEERRKIRARLRELMAEREDQQHAAATSTTEKTETKEKDGAVVTTTTKVTTRTVSGGTAPKQVSPFAKFRQLDKQNSQQSKSTPSTPTTPGGSASPSGSARIFQFTDPALNARAATVKDQLLQWCQMKTQEYENVQINNFSTSWSDGLAFCALIHHFLPDAFDYSKLTPQSRRHNFTLAFTVADEKAGIAPLLDVEDMVVMKRPDWKCVFIYVQAIYGRFRNCQ